MVGPKVRFTASALVRLSILVVSLVSWESPAAAEWRTLSSYKQPRRMIVIDDTLWVVSSGGLLAVHNRSLPGKQFTNVDGIGTTDLHAFVGDNTGRQWVAGNGRLVRFDQSEARQFVFTDNDGEPFELFALADDGDDLWVGTSIGLVLFSKIIDDGQIQDSYGRFGTLPDFPEVRDVLLYRDTLWLATSAGLAYADAADPVLLKSRYNWKVIESAEFDNGGLLRVVWFGEKLYVAASTGLWRVRFGPSDTTAERLNPPAQRALSDLKIENDSLFFYYTQGYGVIADSTPALLSIGNLSGTPLTGSFFDNRRWLAMADDGLFYEDGGEWVEYAWTGLPSNAVRDITITGGKTIVAAFADKPAAFLDGDLWVSYDYYISARNTVIISDSAGASWVGTFGAGLYRLQSGVAVNYDEQNSTLIGNNDDPPPYPYIVINGLATDGDYLFAACYRAADGNPVAVADLSNIDDPVEGWSSIGSDQGVDHTFVSSLDYHRGQVAVGNEFSGVYLCEVGEEPLNIGANACRHFTESNSFLRSDNVRVVKFAPDGILWVGTNVGLSRYDPGIERFVDVNLPAGVDRDITDLEFDGRGNLYIGTRSGLARFDATDGSFEVYLTTNSDLVADRVYGLTLEKETGDLYVATDAGISLLTSSVAEIVFDLDEVVAFPNPFVINSPGDSLAFNFGRSGSVRIFTPAGELVTEMDANRGWFGRNDSGQPVASGVYLFILEDNNGAFRQGKILLVRK